MKDDRDDRRDPDDRRDRNNRRDPSRRDSDREELDERVAELEALVRELQAELGEPPRGPLGLPRPPTPGEVLSFTGEYAIPTAISVLEANVRALQALQQVIRVLDPERSVVGEERDRLETRAVDASRATLDRLEDALGDVESVVRESDLPREGEARDILEDARRINRDIRDRVDRSRREADEARERERGRETDRERGRGRKRGRDDADRGSDFDARSTTIEVTDADEDADTDDLDDSEDSGQVDVDAELRSIKDELESREENQETSRKERSADSDDGEAKDEEGESDRDDAEESHRDADDGDDRER